MTPMPWENDGDDEKPWSGHANNDWRGDVHAPDLDAGGGLQHKSINPNDDGIVARLCAMIGVTMMGLLLDGTQRTPYFLVLSIPDYRALLKAAQREWGEDVEYIGELNGLRVATSDTQFNSYASILDEQQSTLATVAIEISE